MPSIMYLFYLQSSVVGVTQTLLKEKIRAKKLIKTMLRYTLLHTGSNFVRGPMSSPMAHGSLPSPMLSHVVPMLCSVPVVHTTSLDSLGPPPPIKIKLFPGRWCFSFFSFSASCHPRSATLFKTVSVTTPCLSAQVPPVTFVSSRKVQRQDKRDTE